MEHSENLVVSTDRLVKNFGTTRALDGLNLQVATGEVHGFLGPNGAGKSTTLRILLGLIKADSGRVRILGRDPWTSPITTHSNIAYVPGDVSLWPTLSGGETIDLLTDLRGGADATLRRQLVSDFDLDVTKKARTYSKGNRQKVALIAAFARPASLYIFDEPTSGLDPLIDAVFRSYVQRVREAGSSVLLSSHLLTEVEHLCERVTIIRQGTVVETGSLAELRHLTRTTFRLTTDRDTAVLAALPAVHNLRTTDGVLEFDVDADGLEAALRITSTLQPAQLSVGPPSLESLFMQYYKEQPTASSP